MKKRRERKNEPATTFIWSHALDNHQRNKRLAMWWTSESNRKKMRLIILIDICVVDNDVDESRIIVSHVHHISLSMNTILRDRAFSDHTRSIFNIWTIHQWFWSFSFFLLLSFLVPPQVISHSPEDMRMTVREGRDARFSCTASGRPAPVILWHVNGLSRPGIVTTSKTIEFHRSQIDILSHISVFFWYKFLVAGNNESVLILRNISRFDSGRVDCSASNSLSTVNRQFLLYVKCKWPILFFFLCENWSFLLLDKPTVTVPFHSSYFRLYDSATIICRACSLPSPSIFDFFRPKQAHPIVNGIKEKFDEIFNQTCRQLTITIYVRDWTSSFFLHRHYSLRFDQLSDSSLFGSYVCRARNSVGISHAEFNLKGWCQLLDRVLGIINLFVFRMVSIDETNQIYYRTSSFLNRFSQFISPQYHRRWFLYVFFFLTNNDRSEWDLSL